METLIKQVQAVRAQLDMKPLSNPKKLGKAKLEAQLAELTKKLPQPKAKRAEGEETIKAMSCRLLCEVVATSEEGRTIGRPYQEILDLIMEARPEAKTSLNCLRWYAGKIRILADGYHQFKLPQLRFRPSKAEAESA